MSSLSDAEIVARLVLSEHTVHRHVANIRTKLGVVSRSAAVERAANEIGRSADGRCGHTQPRARVNYRLAIGPATGSRASAHSGKPSSSRAARTPVLFKMRTASSAYAQ